MKNLKSLTTKHDVRLTVITCLLHFLHVIRKYRRTDLRGCHNQRVFGGGKFKLRVRILFQCIRNLIYLFCFILHVISQISKLLQLLSTKRRFASESIFREGRRTLKRKTLYMEQNHLEI